MTRLEPFIIDASIALAWTMDDEQDGYADAILAKIDEFEMQTTQLWHLEVAGALIKCVRRKRCTWADARNALNFLDRLGYVVDDETVQRSWTENFELARIHSLSSYDSSYLELAIRLKLPIATLDLPLRAAMAAAGVPLFVP